MAAQLGDEANPLGWFSVLPLNELGGVLVGAGLIGIWLDQFLRREEQALRDLQLREILKDHAPSMRDAVLDAFAANHDDLARVSTPETLDRIASNSLGLRLKDQQFADEIYDDLLHQAINAEERWHDATLAVNLTPLDSHPGYFAVTARWEYTTIPIHSTQPEKRQQQ